MKKYYNTLKVFIIVFVLISLIITPTYAWETEPVKTYADDNVTIKAYDYLNLQEYRGQGEIVLNLIVMGRVNGNVWGTGIYTDDSDVSRAAVHAGIVKVGETKTVEITILPGQSSYVGSIQNGIESYDHAEYEGSFKFNVGTETIVTPPATSGDIITIDDVYYLNLLDYRGLGEIILSVEVTGTTDGNVWGTGVYTDDSGIPKAAVHAGIVKLGETKRVQITILPAQISFEGTTKNGIESYDRGGADGSFKFNDDVQATDKPIPTPTPTPSSKSDESLSSEVFAEGVIMSWQTKGVLGYRLFRSNTENDLGVSVTDFYITSNSYADVNVEPNTTYYYTIKPVLAEADPVNGVNEVLGDVIGKFTITTGSNITKSENTKSFIVLQIDNPNMSVNGKSQEIDPGRGTTPIVVSSRSMVPIRAIVESMNGTINWDNVSQQITLTANGSTVNMWVGKKEITVNGVKREIDVAPLIQNGRTFVPIRFSAENLNAKVDWINSTREAVITYEKLK